MGDDSVTITSWRRGVLALVAGLAATESLVLAFAVSTRPGHTRATLASVVQAAAAQRDGGAVVPADAAPGHQRQ